MMKVSHDQLRAYQAQNRSLTVERIRTTMRLIETEIAKGERRGKRLSRRELCQRAGVGESTLKNPTHRETLAEVQVWLERHEPKKKAGHVSKGERPGDISTRLNLLAQEYDRFKQSYRSLKAENLKLKRELKELRRSGSGASNLRLVHDADGVDERD